jgi:hypothetical protein
MTNLEQTHQVTDEWFKQWPQTDSYQASNGYVYRIPLRLTSTNVVIYGSANLDAVLKEFKHESYRPVTVGNKVPVQIWFNNFIDTDCGPADRLNPYIETWYSFPVTPKSQPLDLPYETPFSYNVMEPNALVWVHRVICGAARDGDDLAATGAILSGREVWGFPKHPAIADLSFNYQNNGGLEFRGSHLGNQVISMRIILPESTDGHVTVPVDAQTGPDTCLTPRQNPLVAGFIPKQTRYGQAFSATMHFSPWKPNTDTLVIYNEENHYGALLKSWQFEPALKMHCRDLKIVAFKPSGWSTLSSAHQDN